MADTGYYLVKVEWLAKNKTRVPVYALYKEKHGQWTTYSSWHAVAGVHNSEKKTIKNQHIFMPITFRPDGKEYQFVFFSTLTKLRAFAAKIIPTGQDIDFSQIEKEVEEGNSHASPHKVESISRHFVVHDERIFVKKVIFKSLAEYMQTVNSYNCESYFVNYVIVQGDNFIKVGYSDGKSTESRFAMYDSHLPTIPRFMIIMLPKRGINLKPDEQVKIRFANKCTKTVLGKNQKEWIKDVDFKTVLDFYTEKLAQRFRLVDVPIEDIHTEFLKDKYKL
jgi:hypothetical protein